MTIYNGKTHCKWQFEIALNYQRVNGGYIIACAIMFLHDITEAGISFELDFSKHVLVERLCESQTRCIQDRLAKGFLTHFLPSGKLI